MTWMEISSSNDNKAELSVLYNITINNFTLNLIYYLNMYNAVLTLMVPNSS